VSWPIIQNRQNSKDEYSRDYIALNTALLSEQDAINKRILRAKTVYAPPFGIFRWLKGLFSGGDA
jgi:hypothetical protein